MFGAKKIYSSVLGAFSSQDDKTPPVQSQSQSQQRREQQQEQEQKRRERHQVSVDLTEVRQHQHGQVLRERHVNALAVKDDDEGPAPRTKTTPPATRPALPPRRPFVAPTGERYQIDVPYPNAYPDPLRALPLSKDYSHMTNPNKRQTDVEDERRLLGDHRNPKGAIPIAIPGAELQTPASRKPNKPGSGGAFRPTNTLGHNNFQGRAGATGTAAYQKAGGKARHPHGLETHTSRGSNVRDPTKSDHFPDSDRPVKKPRTQYGQQTNGYTSKAVQMFDTILSETQKEVSKPQEATPPARTMKRRKLPPWEVSGAQESRHIDPLMSRQRSENRDHNSLHSSRQTNGRPHQANVKSPAQQSKVYEIVDDDDDEPIAVQKHMDERHAKRRRLSDDGQVEIESMRKPRRKSDHLAEFHDTTATKAAKKPSNSAAPIDLDVEEDTAPQSSLLASVRSVLGPTSTAIGTSRQSVDNSVDELNAGTMQSASPRRKSPVKNGPSSALVTDGVSDDEDELHGSGDIRSSFKNGKSVGSLAVDTKPKQRSKGKHNPKKIWQVERLVEPDGTLIEGFEFLNLHVVIGKTSKFLTLEEPGSTSEQKLLAVDGRRFRGLLTSDDPRNSIVRLRGFGNPEPWHDILFHDHEQAMDFVAAFGYLSTVKPSEIRCDKTPKYMETVFGTRKEILRRSVEPAIDAGQEEALLRQRAADRRSNGAAPARSTTSGGRPVQARKLISQMRSSDSSEPQNTSEKGITQPVKRTAPRQTEQDHSAPASSTRPARTTRTRKQKSLTPEPERYSKTVGLGKPWDQPIIYPEVGKKRVTIEFEDLERLDEGVFFNDSLIEFYIRWLKETHPNVGPQTAYFFSTHFYTTLSDYKSAPKTARNRQINYQGVERWTAKDDIFSYDFVVVPVNEHAHWYLAIICNLPNVKRKLESQGDEDGKISQDDAAKGTAAQPVTISESAETQPITAPDSDRQGEAANEPAVNESDEADRDSTPTRGISKKCDDLALSSPQAEAANAAKGQANDDAKDDADKPQIRKGAPAQKTALEEAIEVVDSQTTQQDTSQVSEGVFANAAPPSPEKKKKGKRKSGPGVRKYETSQPAIVILDPMGTNHPGTITQLKHYLIEEASSKRGMELDKSMFQGINAHQGIPEQKNYYDCGVFVCGYLDKFMRDPVEFGQKLLTQEFDLEVDWPEMKPSKMREQMREMLQGIAKEQQKARLERQKAKRAAKKEAAAASSPSKVEDGVVDLSSPVKARDPVKEPKPAKTKAELPREEERAPSRTKSPSKLPAPQAAPIPIDEAEDELLSQSMPDFTSQLRAAADQQDSQASQKSHVSDSSSDVERIPGGVRPPLEEIKIYEDPPINFEEREPPSRLRWPAKSKHYSPDLEL